jgi:hypothetical protein
MTTEKKASAPKRRTRAEVQQLLAEFVSSGMRRSEFAVSVVESCRRLKLSVRDDLAAILPGLADLPIQRVPALTPATWRCPQCHGWDGEGWLAEARSFALRDSSSRPRS